MEAKLIVVGGKASKGAVALKLPTVIGRGREAGLTIVHPMISRRHCEVFEADGLLMIRDLDSLNGTAIDGRRIKEAPLPPDGEFTIGPLTFRAQYEYAGDPSALPETVFAEPAAPRSEPQEPWSDTPEPAVEISFFEELEVEQLPPAVEAGQPPHEKQSPADAAAPIPAPPPSPPPAKKTAAPKKKSKGIASMLQGALKKKDGRRAKPSGKAPAAQPPPENRPPSPAKPQKPAEDVEFPFAPEPPGESPSSKESSAKPGDENFDIDSFLDNLK